MSSLLNINHEEKEIFLVCVQFVGIVYIPRYRQNERLTYFHAIHHPNRNVIIKNISTSTEKKKKMENEERKR